ncbi:PspC domain-containing protein [Allosaccharopolyspora coralli]|uniref:PspC domain-containing protein n=1 Tax=Allosaccharopolyspora coralli TaxID=2665642 RepID=A0A5Q3QDL7_9PSEU|nr:PspC domain-containing protein [Allosaccharopolyspora coralli]QGK71456.1 PspC domain-containing protein [Allosaccharopolyspora coralli]
MNESSKSSALGGIEDTARDFWATRPVRPREGGKIGGVCVALGRRYGVDPVLLRVAFAVGAFYGGAGLLLYLLGWLVLPKEAEASDGRAHRPTSTPVVVFILCMLLPLSFIVWDFAGLLGLLAGVTGLYLLHRHRSEKQAAVDTSSPQATTTDAPTGHTWVYPGTRTAEPEPEEQFERRDPPAWDPLGAAPFAWDLPEPGAPEPEPEPEPPVRRSVTLVTVGLAMLAGGVGFAVGMAPAAALATALGVLGLGMVAGAFLRGGRGLIGFAVPVAVLAVAFSLLPTGPWRGVSDTVVEPTTVQEVRPSYEASVGNIELHLDGLPLSPDGAPLRTSANVGLGNISVYVPENVDLQVTCSADRGHVDCLGSERGGRDLRESAEDLGADGPGGGRMNLELEVGTGNVEVHRV